MSPESWKRIETLPVSDIPCVGAPHPTSKKKTMEVKIKVRISFFITTPYSGINILKKKSRFFLSILPCHLGEKQYRL